MNQYIDIVFDGPPGAGNCRFVEVENERRKSIQVGEWIEPKPDTVDGEYGYWRLRIKQEPTINALAEMIHNISTSKGFAAPSMENLPTKLMLSVSELAEAMEEHRKERGLVYYQCEVCGARSETPTDEVHFVAGSKLVNLIFRYLGKGPFSVPCPGVIAKPEGILPELADSIIRNLHMMHSLIVSEGWTEDTVGGVIREKVEFNAGRPQMHGGNIY